MNVILLSGISGSGKNTYINRRFRNSTPVGVSGVAPINGIVCSADDFFEKTGSYVFDPKMLGDAHGECLRKFIDEASFAYEENQSWKVPENLIVNNTNTTIEELAPYVSIASAYKHPIEIVTIMCPPHIAAARSLHINSLDVLKSMHDRLMSRKIPRFWRVKQTTVSEYLSHELA